MTANGYFANWSNSNTEVEPIDFLPFEDYDICELNDFGNPDLNSFHYSPKVFFQENGDQAPDIIHSFLNSDLIHTDACMFKDLYMRLLKHVCLAQEKEIPIQAISRVIGCNGYLPDNEVFNFLNEEGLLELTDEMFEMLIFKCERK